MSVFGVKFKSDGRIYNFSSEEIYKIGSKVIVETERGLQLGEVANIQKEKIGKELKEIKSLATDEDYNKYLKNVKDANAALVEIRKMTKEKQLNMNVIDSSYSFDRKVLLFNFISDERIDFRELVRELAAKYHTRIELHQVGIRDKAKEIGGIGLCGRVLCCHGCLKNVNPVNINMVKNQNIALNPTKINGACGRLLCCFTYENDLYLENRQELPRIGEKVMYKDKEVTVVDLDIINKKYTVKTGDSTTEEVSL